MAVVPPETGWTSLPAGVSGVIFTSGGPSGWQGPGQGVSVIQGSSNSRARLPARAVVRAPIGAALYRTDRVGTVELVSSAGGFRASNRARLYDEPPPGKGVPKRSAEATSASGLRFFRPLTGRAGYPKGRTASTS